MQGKKKKQAKAIRNFERAKKRAQKRKQDEEFLDRATVLAYSN